MLSSKSISGRASHQVHRTVSAVRGHDRRLEKSDKLAYTDQPTCARWSPDWPAETIAARNSLADAALCPFEPSSTTMICPSSMTKTDSGPYERRYVARDDHTTRSRLRELLTRRQANSLGVSGHPPVDAVIGSMSRYPAFVIVSRNSFVIGARPFGIVTRGGRSVHARPKSCSSSSR